MSVEQQILSRSLMCPTTIGNSGKRRHCAGSGTEDSPYASATNPHTIQKNSKISNGMSFALLHFRKTLGEHDRNHRAPSRNKHFSCSLKEKENESQYAPTPPSGKCRQSTGFPRYP